MKKQKRKLKTAEDTLRMRWSKVLNTADKYGTSHQTKSYPKRKLLPEFDEEAFKPPQSKKKRPPGRIDDQMTGQEQHGAPHTSRHMISIKIFRKRITRPGLSMGQKRRLQEVTQPAEHLKTTAHPNTGAPHTHYVSPTRYWIMDFQRDSNP